MVRQIVVYAKEDITAGGEVFVKRGTRGVINRPNRNFTVANAKFDNYPHFVLVLYSMVTFDKVEALEQPLPPPLPKPVQLPENQLRMF